MDDARFNERAFAAFLEKEFGEGVRISRLGHVPRKTVFRMTGARGYDCPLFVKCAPLGDCARSWRFLVAARLPFLPRPVRFCKWNGQGVLCLGWLDGRIVKPEDMTPGQTRSLMEAHERVLAEMRRVGVCDCGALPRIAERFGVLADFARRHVLARLLLRGLVTIPERLRTYDESRVVPIVNDFHCDNYAFDGDRVSAIYDFDWMRMGSPAEDLTYAVVRRLKKAGLAAEKKRRVRECYGRMVAMSKCPREECVRAINMFRIEFAAKRAASHLGNPLVAIDIFRRDRELRRLSCECLAE